MLSNTSFVSHATYSDLLGQTIAMFVDIVWRGLIITVRGWALASARGIISIFGLKSSKFMLFLVALTLIIVLVVENCLEILSFKSSS